MKPGTPGYGASMENKAVVLLVGAVIGAFAGILVWTKVKADEATAHAVRQSADMETQSRLELLEQENAELKSRLGDQLDTIEQLSKQIDQLGRPSVGDAADTPTKASAKPGEGLPPLTDEELEAGLKEFGGQLQSVILGRGDKAVEELQALLKRAPQWRALVEAEFTNSTGNIQRRLVAAHILAQSGDPEAFKTLEGILRDPDRDMLEHRFTAHALAFTNGQDAVPLLTDIARNGKEPGARANAAFGLARRDIDEGFELYMQATDDAFAASQPEALQYLGGLRLLGEKANPYVRERLLTYKDETALIMLIEVVKSSKDKQALEQLNKLAYDASRPKSVQNAAQGAINVLSGAK
jgi:hypothetical protein